VLKQYTTADIDEILEIKCENENKSIILHPEKEKFLSLFEDTLLENVFMHSMIAEILIIFNSDEKRSNGS
jgi:hypothetical protein